ncbi:hypothetical protein B0H11DRAFT_1728786 [Mycena galericulata]|nr:hypothetical protein B0H11DRAFT_1728786 [Mycena galericulata]
MATDPLLPVELEREIFEFTVHMHPNSIPTLLRVARRVLIWLEPLLYRVTRAGTFFTPISRAIKSKPPPFFPNAVRHLYLGDNAYRSLKEAMQVLAVCTGVVNLALMRGVSRPIILPILAEMKIQRMAVHLAILFGNRQVIYLRHQSFAHITHLDVFDKIGEEEAHLCSQITALPALTHLCLNGQVPWSTIQTFLTDCSKLELLFVSVVGASKVLVGTRWALRSPIRDTRFAVGVKRYYWVEWQNGARGLPDFCSVAENFVAQKRSGAIDGIYVGCVFCLIYWC